ncbi:hypothetical protein ECDEC4D_0711 [Escherichia coli DEC4D]|nr:hypothetical protein ECDEC4A_0742 [Escherichia coli DEC4A]EHV14381.1 hypothetical protein ECDEC4D_0711 [Escherichia coli DEC4D]EHW48557.1 hypothetical protein ECDEC9C_1486 [Escherichia coli DEC9C]EHW74137.1 hypothetical protein ECDEC10C_2889 [Escherichia coli DEC10C]EHW77905.1 hypothetical protein ECDEC10D_3125 [Escherichia coli DEC10D]
MYRNRVKKPEPESNHRMTICQWQVIKKGRAMRSQNSQGK